MNIKILDSWLREHLETTANPEQIAQAMSLCGPTFDKTTKVKTNGKSDYLYDIEITTNRVDVMSVRGIAREAVVILPEFGYKTKLKPLDIGKTNPPQKSVSLNLKSNPKLTQRVMGVVMEVKSIGKSPKWLSSRLEASGIRSLNTAVDITNYVMTEIGHPTHVFDYDLIKPNMFLRESKKGEEIESFDGKKYTLPGGDIVIDNGRGEIIDLPGIIGTKNSVVRNTTKRILFFLETNNPVRIRKTSMTLDIRTVAATLNEKKVDPNLAKIAMKRGMFLLKQLLHAKQISKIYDLYPKKIISKNVSIKHAFLEEKLGIKIKPTRVVKILANLEFLPKYDKKTNTYSVTAPTYRSGDISIPEDVVEEIARIYGYHNLPSALMTGSIPDPLPNAPFDFEYRLKRRLKELGGTEIYTYSMVDKTMAGRGALKLNNPLGSDSSHMRTTLLPSLRNAVLKNIREKNPFHLFEMANIYLNNPGNLPNEKLTLSGIFVNQTYRESKGTIETFLQIIRKEIDFKPKDSFGLTPSTSAQIIVNGKTIGKIGLIENSKFVYYEFDMEKLGKFKSSNSKYIPIPKYPAQIEDISLILPERTRAIDIIKSLLRIRYIVNVKLNQIHKNTFTFRVWYQSPKKTLTNLEVKKIRKLALKMLISKHGATLK